MASLWVTSNPIFRQWALCSAILGAKMLSMAFFTARLRLTRNVFANPEDAALKRVKVKTDEDVERVRRAHLNDLESIPVFWMMSLLYVLTGPSLLSAKICFYGFTAARIGHTFCYMNQLMPYRFMCFLPGQAINVFLAVSVIYNFILQA